MKLCRYGKDGFEKPGMIDADGKLRDLSKVVANIGPNELSPRVFSIGGRLGYEDDGETPNTVIVYHDYGKVPLIFEVRGLPEKARMAGASASGLLRCACAASGRLTVASATRRAKRCLLKSIGMSSSLTPGPVSPTSILAQPSSAHNPSVTAPC